MDTLEAWRRGNAAIRVMAKRPGGDLSLATQLIKQGHKRLGPQGVLDLFRVHLKALARKEKRGGPRKRDSAQQRREGLIDVFEKIVRNEHLNQANRHRWNRNAT